MFSVPNPMQLPMSAPVAQPKSSDEPNSAAAIEARVAAGSVGWDGVVVLSFARLILAFVAQGLTATVLKAQGDATPFAAARWFTVHGTLVDLGSLALLAFFLRREGLRLSDLFRARVGAKLGVSLLQVPLLLVVFGTIGFGAGALTSLATTGQLFLAPPTSSLPLWAGLYSTLVWPLLWGFVEQMTYDGYCAPRARALGRSKWALAVVVLGWAAQHLALPFRPDLAFLAGRFFPSLAIAVTSVAIYLRTRNLLPLAIAHWLIDAATGTLTLQ